ncbi:MAG: glycosyltransferase [Candidatus Helarchaeota archaeon]|nr:glycosyltransferase [Candidatus Helarchaeota archaeon]
MRILVIPELDWVTALQNRVHKIFNRLAKTNEIHVIYFEHEKKGIERTYRLRNKIILHKPPTKYYKNMLLFYTINSIAIYAYINRLIRFFKIDLIVTTNFLFAPLAIRAARKYNIPCIFDLVDFQPFHINYLNIFPSFIRKFGGALLTSILKFDISRSDHIITTGVPLRDYVKQMGFQNVSIISNGVDNHLFNPSYDKAIIQRKYNITPPIICFIGALEYWIDYANLFQSLSLLSAQFPSFFCLCIGPSRHYGLHRIKQLATKYKVARHIIFTDRIPYPQLPLYICASDVCILPFAKNTLTHCIIPMKLLEYLACARPVLSVRLAGVQSIAHNAIFYADTPLEFVKKLAYIIKNPQKISEKIATGTAIAKKYNWDDLATLYEQTLQQVFSHFME